MMGRPTVFHTSYETQKRNTFLKMLNLNYQVSAIHLCMCTTIQAFQTMHIFPMFTVKFRIANAKFFLKKKLKRKQKNASL